MPKTSSSFTSTFSYLAGFCAAFTVQTRFASNLSLFKNLSPFKTGLRLADLLHGEFAHI